MIIKLIVNSIISNVNEKNEKIHVAILSAVQSKDLLAIRGHLEITHAGDKNNFQFGQEIEVEI